MKLNQAITALLALAATSCMEMRFCGRVVEAVDCQGSRCSARLDNGEIARVYGSAIEGECFCYCKPALQSMGWWERTPGKCASKGESPW